MGFLRAFLIIILAIAVPVAGAAYQTPPNSVERWTLSGSGAAAADPFTMFRAIPDTDAPAGGIVSIEQGQTAVWVSNESSLASFEMGGGERTFTARLQVRTGSILRVAVATVNETSQSMKPCSAPRTLDVGAAGSLPTVDLVDPTRAELHTVTFQPSSCAIAKGEKLALLVTALGGPARLGTEDAERITGAVVPRSTLSFAFTPPAWPTPELPSLALAAGGLGLAALALARRRP